MTYYHADKYGLYLFRIDLNLLQTFYTFVRTYIVYRFRLYDICLCISNCFYDCNEQDFITYTLSNSVVKLFKLLVPHKVRRSAHYFKPCSSLAYTDSQLY